jgi:UDPglucose--hexose-1-phosphate uridylyltransferase
MEKLTRNELWHADGRRLLVYGAYDGQQLPRVPIEAGLPELHLRHDALTDRWVAVSPARNTRPQSRRVVDDGTPDCPLCPFGPEVPFAYEAAVFENRFPTLVAAPPPPPDIDGPTAPSRGRCEVVLYTPTHEGSLATLTSQELARVVAIWTDRSRELWEDPTHAYVLVFENRGEDVGATLSHPHGQIYAIDHVPHVARARVETLERHRDRQDACLTCEIVQSDLGSSRTVAENHSFTIGVPFAANWPFEVHVRAKRHGAQRLTELTEQERRDLADGLRTVVRAYDQLYPGHPLAYMMVCQQAPADPSGTPTEDWHLSFEFMPPNRGPDKLKFRASVETAAGLFINDTVPEASAAQLAGVASATHGSGEGPVPDVEVAQVTARGHRRVN